MLRTIFTFIWIIILSCTNILAQEDNYEQTEKELTALAEEVSALNEKVNISVTNVSIQEFLRGVANSSGLNINVDPSINITVVNNFSNVRVLDVLLFLCKEYNLDITTIGSIINVGLAKEPTGDNIVEYDKENNLLTLDYKATKLSTVAREITKKTGRNIVLSHGIGDMEVGGYIQEKPFDAALEKFGYSNMLDVKKTTDNFYVLTKAKEREKQQTQQGTGVGATQRRGAQQELPEFNPEDYGVELDIRDINNITLYAEGAPLYGIAKEISDKLDINYIMLSGMEGKVSLNIENADYDTFLESIMNGTNYAFKKEGNIYLMGEREIIELKEFKAVQLQYRTTENVMDYLPDALTGELQVKEFPDLNSFVVSGSPAKVRDFEDFIRQIDVLVPVILIEIIIVDISKSYTLSTGIEAGLSENAPKKSSGKFYPGIDVEISSKTINDILGGSDGLGAANLGRVKSNFYLTLKALEDQGILRIRSTPKLATLNGKEASISIGETEYYLEEQLNVIGTQNPTQTKTQTYKSVTADLNITLKPRVSGDEQVTMDIEVKQSDFTKRISKTAPPGQVTRNFKSSIRVKNQDMVLLGGLEEKRIQDSGSGVPFLSRIPVIKWLFSSRTNTRSKSKLNLFIKPTIIQ